MSKKTREELAREQMLKAYRAQIQDEELLARMNKAGHDKMYYFIEGIKLIPEYGRLIEEQEKLRAEQIAKADKAIEDAFANKEGESDPVATQDSEQGSLEIGDALVD